MKQVQKPEEEFHLGDGIIERELDSTSATVTATSFPKCDKEGIANVYYSVHSCPFNS